MEALTSGISFPHEPSINHSEIVIRVLNSHRIDSGALYIGYVCRVFFVFG